jgi:aminoglycoside phosphotransferase
MNLVLDFIDRHRELIASHEPRAAEALATILLTPRFRASRHVVFLLVHRASGVPLLVAKVARLQGSGAWSEREADNLHAAHAARRGGFASIPRVLACEEHRGHAILLETALAGSALDPAAMRAQPRRRVRAVGGWLIDFQKTQRAARGAEGPIDARLDEAFAILARLGAGELDRELERTRALAAPLRGSVASVFEHGDLSHPNLLELEAGGIGVLDWETADPQGLPASDLFVFLCYAAFACKRATELDAQRRAFHSTFFEETDWVREACTRYADALEIERETLRPLFALSWLRGASSFAQRLDVNGRGDGAASDAVRWIRESRHTVLWQHTLQHWDELRL